MILTLVKKKWSWLWVAFLFVASLIYRSYGVVNNHPFWVDEFSTASQAQLYLKYGINVLFNPQINFEYNNYSYHLLAAVFFNLFGQSEFVARLPSILIGSTIPILLFLLGKSVFNKTTAVSASLLTTFSYFEIVWSRQARGYILLQAVVLLSLLIYIRILEEKQKKNYLLGLFFSLLILGILTHFLFYILLIAFALHYALLHRISVLNQLVKVKFYISITIIGALLFKLRIFHILIATYSTGLIKANNVWYYHSFLWREYGLIAFLAVVGIAITLFKKKKTTVILASYMTLHLLFISFFISPYVTRYTLPVFPLLLLFAGYALTQFTLRSRIVFPIILTLFITLNGDKFAVKPKQFYSVNHDFREIAVINYDEVYDIITKKGKLEEQRTAIIDTWHDRLFWYVGDDYPGSFWFHWIDAPGLTNGLVRRADFIYSKNGDKIMPKQKNLKFIGELSDLEKAVAKYPKGFIFIDDASLPKDVIDYAEKNFKKEIYLDHYPLDDNPYSIWPATLYSWGIN